ncbi:MATE family efflux transporter [Enterovibrio norvegicus FF-454]|uniref:MATE family efflux transporter n=1 Tax=Enterovibrio norvegicus FF-454 TaxID=1185651 RepID=A0A1E5CFU6_9GAMM|nr:MATE family efflux transporter DinF [Enterovibrio norvegicus]OEE64357.1 MATE family efflux transporter [Enterovibrio norvegicus FF-454]
MFSALKQKSLHVRVLSLAFPMVLSNITVPLLGLVDAAVIGHLDHAWYLGGVAIGSTMIAVTFWLLGFLRMATTGLTAQAWGADDKTGLANVFLQGITLAWVLALIILALHPFISNAVFSFSDASAEVKLYADEYFSVRIWSAPAALTNLVIMGWLLGAQNAKKPMMLIILVNLVNIVLDLLFVVGFGWKVEGAAAASVIADYSGMFLGLYFVAQVWAKSSLPSPITQWKKASAGMSRLAKLNRDIFLRSLCLQMAFTFMTFQGATLGDDVVAANAVLMNFLMLVSFAMDGFAYAMEAMVGKAIGARNRQELLGTLTATTFWSLIISLMITLAFLLGGQSIVGVISDIPAVREQAYLYLPWLIAMPLVSMWCFLLDGVFIGATRGREMRNTMFFAMAGFFAIWWLLSANGNHALWAAMLGFMALRGVTLGILFAYQWRRGQFLLSAHS